jgi:hypothetical protein
MVPVGLEATDLTDMQTRASILRDQASVRKSWALISDGFDQFRALITSSFPFKLPFHFQPTKQPRLLRTPGTLHGVTRDSTEHAGIMGNSLVMSLVDTLSGFGRRYQVSLPRQHSYKGIRWRRQAGFEERYLYSVALRVM